MKTSLIKPMVVALLHAAGGAWSAFALEEHDGSSSSSVAAAKGKLRGTSELTKKAVDASDVDTMLSSILTSTSIFQVDEEDGEFSMEDLLIFAKECYSYKTAKEKRACQRSMKRFSRCIEKKTRSQCCRDADTYQRDLKCPSSPIGKSICVRSPDHKCYKSGRPPCCDKKGGNNCPDFMTMCDNNTRSGSNYCTWGPDKKKYKNGWPKCCSKKGGSYMNCPKDQPPRDEEEFLALFPEERA